MKTFIKAFGLIALVLTALPAQSALVNRAIEGDIVASFGGSADVGAGTVTGFVEYDDALGVPGFLGGDLFDLTAFELMFSNGPTITELDDPFATIEVDPASGALLDFFALVLGLTGFGLNGGLDLSVGGVSPELFFSDANGSSQVEGSLRFEPQVGIPVPAPAPLALLALSLVGLGLSAHRRSS